MKNKKNLSEILANNLAYYVNDPKKRCIADNGICRYSGTTLDIKTKGCFIGALLPAKKRIELDQKFKGNNIASIIKRNECKLPKLITNNIHLMVSFQGFHDNSSFWSDSGLSLLGKVRLKTIISDYSLEEKYFEKFLAE